MTLLDAAVYDEAKARRRKMRIIWTIVVVVLIAGGLWWFRYWPQERMVGHFFDALQTKDFNTAYAIWMNDADWQKHPGAHPKYPFNEFYQDWGPGGQWGTIKTFKVYGASRCPPAGGESNSGSGIVVDVVVNDRTEHAQVWVEKSDHTLSYPPCELIFR